MTMRSRRGFAVLAVVGAMAVTALAATTATATSSAGPAGVANVCPPAAPGHVQCFAQVRTDVHGGTGIRGARTQTALPAGYGPAELASAYRLPSTGGAGQTVAIVDAGDDATAEADLAVYRATYGLPACTTANGCFRKVNQAGTTSPMPADQGWGIEISLDLDMVSASCPDCHILLVESNTSLATDMAAAENTAVALGATEVSNSYGGQEYGGMLSLAAAYRHPGVAILASTGDSGYGPAAQPAAFDSVIAVGGTSLTRAANARGWTETAWRGALSGCSAWIAKPSWQHDPDCPNRMIADVAAVADPQTGVAVYDAHDGRGWLVVGGTSASSPFLAGVIALGGHPDRFPTAQYLYDHASALNDVVSGSNATFLTDCGGDYQCTAGPGYDGPTGNGTPNGLGAF